MMNTKNMFFWALCLILISSCANLVPYSEALKNQYHLSDAEIPKIQFYNSSDIVLYKEVTNGGIPTVQGGKIKIIDGRQVEEITIKGITKGIALKNPLMGNNMGVSFEINDSYFLTFGENPKFNNKYCLLASNWKNDIGEVSYNGEKYRTPSSSGRVYLMVNVKKLQKMDTKTRVASGRKVK